MIRNLEIPRYSEGLRSRTGKLVQWQSTLERPFAAGSSAEGDTHSGRAGATLVTHASFGLHMAFDFLGSLGESSVSAKDWSASVLTRAVMFNAVHILWLVGPAEPLVRQRRGAIDAYEELKNAVRLDASNTANSPTKGTPTIDLDKRKAWLEREYVRLDISTDSAGKPTGVASLDVTHFLDKEAGSYFTADSTEQMIASSLSFAWRILAGIDHGYYTGAREASGRFSTDIESSVVGIQASLLEPPNSSHIELTLLLYSVALERLAAYLGCEDEAVLNRDDW